VSGPDPWPDEAPPGRGIIRLDLVGTIAFALVTLVGSVSETAAADLANLVVSAVLFVGGCVAFGVGFVLAAGRSRTEVVDLAGLFYLTGSGPPRARRPLLGLWFAQIAVAVASVFTLQPPFGVMAPVWGIGLITVWGSRHGRFPGRTAEELRRTGPARAPGGP
jgi:hypothetical protein